MKLSHLLAASSVAALLAGAAHAAIGVKHINVGANDVTPGYEIADEVDFTALATANKDAGVYSIEVGTDGTIPPGQNLFLTISVTNGKFTSTLNGSEFKGGVTGAVVNSGGAANGSTVRYLITTDAGATIGSAPELKADTLILELPIDIMGCGNLSFSVTEFQTESGGTPIEGGIASQAVPSVTCVPAYSASIVSDGTDGVISSASSLQKFVANASDTITTARLGNASLTVDSTVHIDMDGTVADPAHVTGFTAAVNFINGANIANAKAVAGLGAVFAATGTVVGNTATLAGTVDATASPATGTITIDARTTTPPALGPMAAQAVSVSGANLTLDTGLNLKATDAFGASDVADLVYDAQDFGPFDWVADTNGSTNNIFRMTGLGTVDVPAQLILTNSNTTGKNGTYPFTILASEIINGEYRLNRQKIEQVVGSAYGTADVTILLSTPNAVDIDRLIATTATGAVVSNYGDGSNVEADGDDVDQTIPTP